MRLKFNSKTSVVIGACFLLPTLIFPHISHATLSQSSSSIEAMRSSLQRDEKGSKVTKEDAKKKGTYTIQDVTVGGKVLYTIHTIIHGNKNREELKEYVSVQDDKVFAVTWKGYLQRDFSKLLGDNFGEFKKQRDDDEAKKNAAIANLGGKARIRGPVSRTESANLIVTHKGHARGIRSGKAIDKALLNKLGISEDEIK